MGIHRLHHQLGASQYQGLATRAAAGVHHQAEGPAGKSAQNPKGVDIAAGTQLIHPGVQEIDRIGDAHGPDDSDSPGGAAGPGMTPE